jgi:hypothetical protein
MAAVAPAPADVEYFLDTRGQGRALRVRRHDEEGVVVLSVWRGDLCVGSFRLSTDDVPALIDLLLARSDVD